MALRGEQYQARRTSLADYVAAARARLATGAGLARLHDRHAPANLTFFRRPFALVGTVGALCLLVVISVRFMAAGPGVISTLWVTSGVAVLTWLKAGRGVRYDLAFGALVFMALMAGELILGNPPHRAIVFVALNLLEIVLCLMILRHIFPKLDVHSVNGQVKLLVTAFCAVLPSALLCGVVLNHGASDGYFGGVRMWFLGRGIGLLVVLATGLAFQRSILLFAHPVRRVIEAVLAFGILIAGAILVFGPTQVMLVFLLLPAMIVIAVRFRVAGTALGLLIISIIAIKGTMAGYGPYYNLSVDRALGMVQVMILFGYAPALIVAALLDERDGLAVRARLGRRKAEMASAAKSRLLANVAHEIKSPVGGIIGIAEMWASGHLGEVTPAQKDMAEMMVRTGRQIEALSHDLLDVSQAESGAVRIEARPTDVAGALADVSKTLSLMPEAAGITLEVADVEPGLRVMADSQRLAQILSNLGSNAVKYGRAGGFVRFAAARSANGHVRLIVQDGGPGLTPEKKAQLFEPFNRLGLERSAIEGHGIGLALSKRLVELQNGQMGVDSEAGEGASFWVELPEAY